MTGRLTAQQRRDRQTTGAALQAAVVDIAASLGYEYAHFRPALTKRGWRTPVEGSLGHGFPDLVLVNPRRGRVVFAELKREIGDLLSPEQQHVVHALRAAGAEVYVFRPSDLGDPAETGRVYETLHDDRLPVRWPATSAASASRTTS